MQNLKEMSDFELYSYKCKIKNRIDELQNHLNKIRSNIEDSKSALYATNSSLEMRIVNFFEDFLNNKAEDIEKYIDVTEDDCYSAQLTLEKLTKERSLDVLSTITNNYSRFLAEKIDAEYIDDTIEYILQEINVDPDIFDEKIDNILSVTSVVNNILNTEDTTLIDDFFDEKKINYLFKRLLDSQTTQDYTAENLKETFNANLKLALQKNFERVEKEYELVVLSTVENEEDVLSDEDDDDRPSF
jgi:hypothetical protein